MEQIRKQAISKILTALYRLTPAVWTYGHTQRYIIIMHIGIWKRDNRRGLNYTFGESRWVFDIEPRTQNWFWRFPVVKIQCGLNLWTTRKMSWWRKHIKKNLQNDTDVFVSRQNGSDQARNLVEIKINIIAFLFPRQLKQIYAEISRVT